MFDGSRQGVTGNVDALARLADGSLLLSFDSEVAGLSGIIPAIVDDSDIVRFDPQTRRYSWYFDGSDVGLTANAEDVDALALLPDGRLAISTVGPAAVTGPDGSLAAADEDVLAFSGTLNTKDTSGVWSLYLDGSALPAFINDLDALAVESSSAGDTVYLSSDAASSLAGVAVADGDLFVCRGLTPGAGSRCASFGVYWRGADNGLAVGVDVDAVDVPPAGP